VDRRIDERHPADFQVRVTSVEDNEISASGHAFDTSQSGIGIYLPHRFTPGSVVRLNVDDSVLFGFVAYAFPERSYCRTGIEIIQVLRCESDLLPNTTPEQAEHETIGNESVEPMKLTYARKQFGDW